jgi:hypothetical protein
MFAIMVYYYALQLNRKRNEFLGKFVVAWKKTCQCNAVAHRNKGEIGVMILHTELHLQLVQVFFHWHFPFTCSNCNKLF